MKTLFTLIIFSVFCSISHAALYVDWSSGNLSSIAPNPDPEDPFETGPQDGWLVNLYVSDDPVMDLGSITRFYSTASGNNNSPYEYPDHVRQTDLVYQTELVQLGSDFFFGEFALDWSAIEGMTVYTVLFNAAEFGNASYAIVLDATPHTLPVSSSENDPYNYHISTANNNWVPVPEPGTVMLGLAGIAILGNKLRKRVKKA